MYETPSKNSDDINVSELVTTHNTRKQTRMKTYMEIYSKCCSKIKYVNDVLLKRECIFSIPSVTWGLPYYQHKAALGFIMIKLRGKGFNVKYANNDAIYINWEKIVDEIMNGPRKDRMSNTSELGIADTTVPKISNIKYKDERFQKLGKNGCEGDCCKNETKKISKIQHTKQNLEYARQQQQQKIIKMLKKNRNY